MASSSEQQEKIAILANANKKLRKENSQKVDRNIEMPMLNGKIPKISNNPVGNFRIKIEDENLTVERQVSFNSVICKNEATSDSTDIVGASVDNVVDHNILNNIKVELPAELEEQMEPTEVKVESDSTYVCSVCQTSYDDKETWHAHCIVCNRPGTPQNEGLRIAIRELPNHRVGLNSSGDRQEPGTSNESTPNAYRGAWGSRRTDRSRRSITKRKEMYQKNLTRSLDSFFSAMCESAKNLPPYSQLQIKKKVFDIIKEAEESTLRMNMDDCDSTDDEEPL